MAFQRKGTVNQAVIAITTLLLCLLLVQFKCARATNYVVGDDKGWSLHVESWTNGKTFYAGDVLYFVYNPVENNVVFITKDGYNSCRASLNGRDRAYTSGLDVITLKKGESYFISNRPGKCEAGQKIKVTAL